MSVEAVEPDGPAPPGISEVKPTLWVSVVVLTVRVVAAQAPWASKATAASQKSERGRLRDRSEVAHLKKVNLTVLSATR